jgi:hypothetical protein
MMQLNLRALSIRQPWAELILRGIKTIEVRSRPTKIRGRVQIYASLGRLDEVVEAEVADNNDLDIDSLPRGVLVGTVELVDCLPLRLSDSQAAGFTITDIEGQYGWHLANPQRASRLLKPTKHPQPVWFNPF